MKLTSVQRRTLASEMYKEFITLVEQDEKEAEALLPDTPDTQEHDNALDASGTDTTQENNKETSDEYIPNEAARVQSALKAVEKLQRAAASLEAARFTMEQEYSDFTLARKLEVIKQELVAVISKAKEHISRSAAKTPEAKQEMAKWLGL